MIFFTAAWAIVAEIGKAIPWKVWLVAGGIALLMFGYWRVDTIAEKRGFAMCEASARIDMDRRVKNALDAENALRGDMSRDRGLLNNDGFKRD